MKLTLFLLASTFAGYFLGIKTENEKTVRSAKKEKDAVAGKNEKNKGEKDKTYTPAKVDFDAFEKLVAEVKEHRKTRLVSLDDFLKMSQEENTIILDTRSDKMYERRHVKGAKHLAFTDFTQANLDRLLMWQKDTRILIYCNNNFDGDEETLPTKIALPKISSLNGEADKGLTLALNIPTYINLYGYGYKNIYELDEFVDVNDARIAFEGTDVRR